MALRLDGPHFAEIPWPAREHGPSVALAVHPVESPTAFERLTRGLGAAIDAGDALMHRAAHGGYDRMDAATLIALQAGIYRYSEAVDFAAKLVDRTASAARTILEAGR